MSTTPALERLEERAAPGNIGVDWGTLFATNSDPGGALQSESDIAQELDARLDATVIALDQQSVNFTLGAASPYPDPAALQQGIQDLTFTTYDEAQELLDKATLVKADLLLAQSDGSSLTRVISLTKQYVDYNSQATAAVGFLNVLSRLNDLDANLLPLASNQLWVHQKQVCDQNIAQAQYSKVAFRNAAAMGDPAASTRALIYYTADVATAERSVRDLAALQDVIAAASGVSH